MGILWSLLAIEDSVIVEYGPAGTTHFSMSLFGELGVDQQMRDFGQASTAIQAFADVL